MWIAVSDLPADGAELRFSDPTIWEGPMREFGMDCRVVQPLEAVVSILPQQGEGVDGCIIRGRLTGEIVVPCNRCAEDASVHINTTFDTFEPFPDALASNEEEAIGEEPDELVVRRVNGVPQINIEGLLWEEFAMILPVKPLCKPDCKGLCPICGHNKNHGECSCAANEGDPRLAALRNVKLAKKA